MDHYPAEPGVAGQGVPDQPGDEQAGEVGSDDPAVSRDDRRMVLPELTKNGRALTRGVHQRMQECEAALFEAALFKDTSDAEMAVFLQVTLRATGQRVNAVQVSPGKHPSVGTVQSVRKFAGSLGQYASSGPGGPDGL